MYIELPQHVKYIIKTLEQAGYEAYAVGGCVRDSIMGRIPNDWDITTSAAPEEVKKYFRRTVDTGIKHGTVTILLEKEGYEVTTYRIDGEYEDNRHPKEVIFTASLEEDLRRRDFTVNAMAYNESQGLVDIFGGIEDLQAGIIRCVGNATERFTEDALRIMRAVRFSAQFGFEIEEETRKAIKTLASNLANISAERIQVELTKLMVSPHPDYLRTAYELGITRIMLPEFDRCMETPQNNPNHCYSVGEHILHSLMLIRPDKTLRFTMLFHDMGKPETKTVDEKGIDHFKGHSLKSAEIANTVLHRLRFDNETIRRVCQLCKYHDWEIQAVTAKDVRRCVARIGEDAFPEMFEVGRADILAQSDYRREEKMTHMSELETLYQEMIEADTCLSLKTLAVTGKDLIASGVKPGKQLGVILQRMLEDVIQEPSHNEQQYLMERLSEFL